MRLKPLFGAGSPFAAYPCQAPRKYRVKEPSGSYLDGVKLLTAKRLEWVPHLVTLGVIERHGPKGIDRRQRCLVKVLHVLPMIQAWAVGALMR